MKPIIAIHNSKFGFHPRWISYCKEKNINYKIVNCYESDIIEQLEECQALMWHHSHTNPKDILIARQILFALEVKGFAIFPNFKTAWHFDDKVGQKYLFEALNIPHVKSWVFTDKQKAVSWVNETFFPKVFKLRGGAGSANVRLVKSKYQALKLVNQAFGAGFRVYDPWGSLNERFRKWREGKSGYWDIFKGIGRFLIPLEYAQIKAREKGYIYFQEFIPGNDSDFRIIIIDEKAFALKRFVRQNDFRASGSGSFAYERELFPENIIRTAFEINDKIQTQCGVYDFVLDKQENPLLIEVSYGFSSEAYDKCPGHWDRKLTWHEGNFNSHGWMIESVIKELQT